MSSSPSPFDAKAMLQELRSNRRTQAALIGFALILAYLVWPDSTPRVRRTSADREAGSAFRHQGLVVAGQFGRYRIIRVRIE